MNILTCDKLVASGEWLVASETPPHAPRPTSLAPRAFTLIELLIVIGIMLILVMLAATTMRPDVEGRRIRESARSVNVYLASARNRAMETGRPAGVIFRRLGGANGSMDIDQCEVPPNYCGETEYAVAAVQAVTGPPAYVSAVFYDDYTTTTVSELPPGIVQPGDLIQFNLQGPMYRILDDSGAGGMPANKVQIVNGVKYVVTDSSQPLHATIAEITQNTLIPVWTVRMPYRIFRAPMKGAAQPLELPAGAIVDFTASGEHPAPPAAPPLAPRYRFGDGGGDVAILFSPTGGIDKIYVGGANGGSFMPTNLIYLLIGKREKLLNPYQAGNTNPDTMTNYQDQNNMWVVINPQTGLINTEPLALSGSGNEQSAVNAARGLALEAKGMGGR
jgi:prepilin-type N-terminal cleavage/methylation domain-containing protein